MGTYEHGDLDDSVGDVGDLGLARPVAQPDIGGDAVIDEIAAGELRILSGHSDAIRQFLDGRDRRVLGDGDDERSTARSAASNNSSVARSSDPLGNTIRSIAATLTPPDAGSPFPF